MATTLQVGAKIRTEDEIAADLLQLIDGYFDDIGLSNTQKEARYDALDKSLTAKNFVPAKA